MLYYISVYSGICGSSFSNKCSMVSKKNNPLFMWGCDSIQLFYTFLCNSQNYHPLGAVDDPMALLHEAGGNSASDHPQHRWCDSLTVAQKGMKKLFYYPTQVEQRVIICAMLMRVWFVYNGRPWRIWGMIWAFKTPNNSFVCGQRHKLWVLVFLVRMSGTLLNQNWTDYANISVFQQICILYKVESAVAQS